MNFEPFNQQATREDPGMPAGKIVYRADGLSKTAKKLFQEV
jgi:hypothetical protein